MRAGLFLAGASDGSANGLCLTDASVTSATDDRSHWSASDWCDYDSYHWSAFDRTAASGLRLSGASDTGATGLCLAGASVAGAAGLFLTVASVTSLWMLSWLGCFCLICVSALRFPSINNLSA